MLLMRLGEPSIGDLLAQQERMRLRERGVLCWVAREARA